MSSKIKRITHNLTDLFKYPYIHKRIQKKTDLYFFFPYWSLGGAERVHIDILNLFKKEAPLCFITSKSSGSEFKKEFLAAANIINLGRWGEKKAYKAHMLKKIARSINANAAPVVFGSNSLFMYELIPFLGDHVKIIDLIHNFSDHKEGSDWYSIPYIPRLSQRIVVGQKMITQFKEFYKQNQVPDHYIERLIVIQNKIPFNNKMPEKNYEGVLQILFVARNSAEKRVNVLTRIAWLCHKFNLPVAFKMIGDFKPLQNEVPPNTKILGEIGDKFTLNNYYKASHLLLLTSFRESWGLVIFEGMNFGTVPISTEVGELSDYISKEKENGVLIENLKDEEKLAARFVEEIRYFTNHRTQLKIFSKNAFDTTQNLSANNNFDAAYKQHILENEHNT